MKQTSKPWVKLPVLFLVVAIAAVLLTATMMVDSPTAQASDDTIQAPTPEPTLPSVIYIGAHASGSIDKKYNSTNTKVSFKRTDILRYIPGTGTWSIFKTKDDLGIPADVNLRDFEVLADGKILFVIDRTKTIAPLGKVTARDVLRWSAGTLSFELQGINVGLTKSDENIDALAVTADDELLISTNGNATYNTIPGKVPDEDLVKIVGNTASLYFDGSAFKLTSSSEDVEAASVDLTTGDQTLYLSTKDGFSATSSVNSVSGKDKDIFGVIPSAFNPITDGFLFQAFNGKASGLKKEIDGISVSFVPAASVAVSAALEDFSENATLDEVDEGAAYDQAEYDEAMSQGDDQITLEDFVEVVQHVYLPVVAAR